MCRSFLIIKVQKQIANQQMMKLFDPIHNFTDISRLYNFDIELLQLQYERKQLQLQKFSEVSNPKNT